MSPVASGGSKKESVAPHLMIVSPHQEEFEHLSRDDSNGMAYVAHLPNRRELFLIIPVNGLSIRG